MLGPGWLSCMLSVRLTRRKRRLELNSVASASSARLLTFFWMSVDGVVVVPLFSLSQRAPSANSCLDIFPVKAQMRRATERFLLVYFPQITRLFYPLFFGFEACLPLKGVC